MHGVTCSTKGLTELVERPGPRGVVSLGLLAVPDGFDGTADKRLRPCPQRDSYKTYRLEPPSGPPQPRGPEHIQ